MSLYDRRLDAVCMAAELGSFTKAAEQLGISTPALVKQINGLEGENGVVLFARSHQGCALTPAGESLVEDARALIRLSDDALRRARTCAGTVSNTVRLGVSLLSPAAKTLESWPGIHGRAPQLKLELVPVGDIYDEGAGVVEGLGRDVDLIQAAYSGSRWNGVCQALPLGTAALSLDVPRSSPLACRPSIALDDLANARIYVLLHACDAMDELYGDMRSCGLDVVAVKRYDLGLFNECSESGGLLVTCGAWAGLHPGLATVPLAEERLASCALLYPLAPSAATQAFIDAFRAYRTGTR